MLTILIDKNIFWNENLLSFQDVEFNINNIIKGNLYKYSCNAYFDYYIRVIPQSNSISQSIKTSLHQNSHIYFIDNLYNILPHEIKQKYKWAIRRRIAYIYTTINANNKIDPCNFEKLKSIVLKNDKLFYPYFITSAKIYNFLHKIKMPKAGHLTFPYYFIYQTVIGRLNVSSSNYALIIGGGNVPNETRKNILTVDWNGKIQTSQMQAGNIDATSVSANSYKDVSVTFSPAMSGTPIVVCSVVSTSTAGAIGSITAAVTSTSTTGFTCRIFNAGSTARTPSVNWIAMNV